MVLLAMTGLSTGGDNNVPCLFHELNDLLFKNVRLSCHLLETDRPAGFFIKNPWSASFIGGVN
jgi:hypothetical protein